MNWIKYADKKPDVGDTVVAKDDGAYFTGKVRSSNYPIHHMYIDDGGCGYEFSKDSEYVILEKSTPAKVVKERPVIQRYDAVNIDAPYRTLIVTYCQEGNYEGRDLFGGHRVFFVREVKQHYRNGELIWSRDE